MARGPSEPPHTVTRVSIEVHELVKHFRVHGREAGLRASLRIPTALVFVVFQRYFTQGANAGAEKG